MTWRGPRGTNRRPLAISWCGNYESGLRIGWSGEAKTTEFYPKHGDTTTPRAWQSGADMPVPWDSEQATVLPYASSDFTGEMHAYAQVLMGHPRANDLFVPSGQGFRADWAYTHGVYIQTLTDGSLQLWCIAISASGVYARKLPHCKVPAGFTAPASPAPGDPVEDWQKWDAEKYKELRGYYPQAPANMDWFDTSANWTLLADAAAVSAFYALSPIYSRCGWCFNSDGSQAVNTAYQYENNGSAEGYHTFEYLIDITPDVNGEPVSAAMSLSSDGYAAYKWEFASPAPARLVVPGGAQLVKWDFSLNGALPIMGAEGEIAPMVSWFDATDSIDGLVHINGRYTVNGPVDTRIPDTDPLPIGVHVEEWGNKADGFAGGVYKKGEPAVPMWSQDGWRDEWTTLTMGHGALRLSIDWRLRPDGHFAAIGREEWHYYDFRKDAFRVGIMPLGDRRAAYTYEMTEDRNHSDHRVFDNASAQRGFTNISLNNQPGDSLQWTLKHKQPPSSSYYYTCDGGSPVYFPDYAYWEFYYLSTFSNVLRTKANPRPDYAGLTYKETSEDTPKTLTIEQVKISNGDTYTFNKEGRCASGFVVADHNIDEYIASPVNETIDIWDRADRLTFHHPDFGDLTLFSRTESYDGASWKTILRPEDGNEYAFQNANYQKMLTWSDMATAQVVYSTEMDGIDGPKLASVLTTSYPVATLPSAINHSWIGAPGAL